MICFLPVTVEPFQFSPAEPVAYELSYTKILSSIRLNDCYRAAAEPGEDTTKCHWRSFGLVPEPIDIKSKPIYWGAAICSKSASKNRAPALAAPKVLPVRE
jgi:hypothetical protein